MHIYLQATQWVTAEIGFAGNTCTFLDKLLGPYDLYKVHTYVFVKLQANFKEF